MAPISAAIGTVLNLEKAQIRQDDNLEIEAHLLEINPSVAS
jgi:hypothetical protein